MFCQYKSTDQVDEYVQNCSYVQIRGMHSYNNSCISFKKANYFNTVYAVTITQRYVTMNKTGADSQPLPLDRRRCACPVTYFKIRPVKIKEIVRSFIQCLFGQYFLVIFLLKKRVREIMCNQLFPRVSSQRSEGQNSFIKKQLLSLLTLHIISYLQLFFLGRIWL